MPGGFLDKDDGSYKEACLRELYEETGVKPLDGTALLGYAESNIDTESRDTPYDVSRLYFTAQASNAKVRLSYEHDGFTWVPLQRALELITYDRQLRALRYIKQAREASAGS
jgi:8-oxo-dGTP pyrophosphatase MutT (NUDIX family)